MNLLVELIVLVQSFYAVAVIYQLWEYRMDTIGNYLSESFCDDMRDTFFIKLGA